MDFSLTEEQELLLASIRELITTNFPEEYFRTCDQNGTYPRELMYSQYAPFRFCRATT